MDTETKKGTLGQFADKYGLTVPQGQNTNRTVEGYADSLNSSAQFQAPTTAEPTVAQFADFSAPTTTDVYGDALTKYNEGLNFNEDTIRSNVLSQFQGEINATKGAYAELLNQVKQQGKGRLGEDTAIQGRRGLLGSDFGAAQTQGVRDLNMSEEQKVYAARAAALSGINRDALTLAQSEIADKRAAKQQGTTAYLNYLSGAEERRTKRLESIANALLTQSVDPLSLDPKQLDTIAKGAGVTTDDIINSYLSGKSAQEKAQAEADAKLAKDMSFNLSEGEARYQYNPETGQVELAAERAKTYAPRSSGGSSLTPYQQFQATQSISKDNQKRTENAREMQRQANLIKTSYESIKNGGNRSLNTQAIVTSFNKILDPTSVVRESEYDRTAQGQALLAQLQGKYDNIVAGGAGVTEATLKEAADIANRYLTASAASIKAENDRAKAMADAFGLNSDFVGSNAFGTEEVSNQDQEVQDLRSQGYSEEQIQQIINS